MKSTVIQRHSYQFMVRESMRVVNLSSSALLPSYFADRRWMGNFLSSGGHQKSASGVLVANTWFNARMVHLISPNSPWIKFCHFLQVRQIGT